MTFDPEDPQMLSQILHNLLGDPDLRRKLVQKGLENQQGFSWAGAASQYEEIFRQALSRRDQPRPNPSAAHPT